MKFKPLTTGEEWIWIVERTHINGTQDSQGIVAYDRRGIHAICVADGFTSDSCCVHFAIDNPMAIRAGFFNKIADHLYITCARERLFGTVPSNNAKALKLDKHIGFKEVARVPHGMGTGVDTVVLSMDKADCRWITVKSEAA